MEFEQVRAIIVETLGCDAEQVTMDASLADDLGADSLASVELVMALEEATGISIEDSALAEMKTVGDVMKDVYKRQQQDQRGQKYKGQHHHALVHRHGIDLDRVIPPEGQQHHGDQGAPVSYTHLNRDSIIYLGGVCPMKIELTEQQFRYLLDLVYIGNWVINSTRENDRIQEYDQVESLIFSHCLHHKMSKLVELYRGCLLYTSRCV